MNPVSESVPYPPEVPESNPFSQDVRIIALIGLVHGTSHFFHLLLPTLFPWLMPEFGLDFVGVGGTVTVFFVVSGLGQALAGFLVDRLGAVKVLCFGMLCFSLAAVVLAGAGSHAQLFIAAGIAGLGNSVFHPADFTILNRRVSPPRLGHAFSVHGLSGNLGWAAAPVFLTGFAALFDWRWAALLAGLLPLPALLLLWLYRDLLGSQADKATPADAGASNATVSRFGFLASLPVWLCFLFFFLITAAFGAIQNFSPTILKELYGLSVAAGAASLSGYMLAAAGGIIVGGFVAQKAAHDGQIAVALGLAAFCAIVLAAQWMPGWSIPALMAGVGFFTGIAGPSRDLLVRRAATARFGQAAYGRIYGFVYSGLDLGLATAPLLFGAMMDHGQFARVLVGVAFLQVAAVFSALRVGRAT